MLRTPLPPFSGQTVALTLTPAVGPAGSHTSLIDVRFIACTRALTNTQRYSSLVSPFQQAMLFNTPCFAGGGAALGGAGRRTVPSLQGPIRFLWSRFPPSSFDVACSPRVKVHACIMHMIVQSHVRPGSTHYVQSSQLHPLCSYATILPGDPLATSPQSVP